MKVFISWSGERSRIIAEGLNNWLPKVIQAVKPFYSPEIEKGTRGIAEINATLEGTNFGIICLTPENLKSEWIHYEAGALSKIEGARIWTLLYNLKHSDIIQPLAQFQHTLATKEDIYKLLDSMNAKLPDPLEKAVLKDSFERSWSDFDEVLKKAKKITETEDKEGGENIRSDREVLNEMLEILRIQQRAIPQYLNNLSRDVYSNDRAYQKLSYSHLVFSLADLKDEFEVDMIKEALQECIPHDPVRNLTFNNDYSVEVQFFPPKIKNRIEEYLDCLSKKLIYNINKYTLIKSDGVIENIEIH